MLNNSGMNEVNISAGTFSSGEYVYALLINGKKIDSKHIIVTKQKPMTYTIEETDLERQHDPETIVLMHPTIVVWGTKRKAINSNYTYQHKT